MNEPALPCARPMRPMPFGDVALRPAELWRDAPATGQPAVFIDQEGALFESAAGAAPAHLRPAAPAALTALSAAGFALVVLARPGGPPPRQAALEQRLLDEAGVELTDLLLCPHAALPGRPACRCRRPAPGLLQRAASVHRLDLSRSWMVGSGLDDIEAGRRAGCRTLLLDGGGPAPHRRSLLRSPHARCRHWREAVDTILAGGLAA